MEHVFACVLGFGRAGVHVCFCMLECMSHLNVGMNARLHVLKEVSASRMLLRMGQAAPFRKGGFSQALFFPKQNALEFRDLRIATRGSASGLRELFEKSSIKNFNPVRAGCVIINP